MINYYKILQIDDYSDVPVVKRQYRRLAKLYHPDVNPDHPEAEEIIKLINTANTILSDPQSKYRYDLQLKHAYELVRSGYVEPSVDEVALRRQRMQDIIRRKLRDDIKKFEKDISIFPVFYRYGLGITIGLWGLQMIYSNWFVNLLYEGYTVLVFGFIIFVGAASLTAQFYDRHRWYLAQTNRNKQVVKRSRMKLKPMTLFMIILIGGPILIFGISVLRKSYHLSTYGEIAVGRILYVVNGNSIRYQFTTRENERVIKNEFTWDADDRMEKNNIIYVKYSKHDPTIAEIIWPESED